MLTEEYNLMWGITHKTVVNTWSASVRVSFMIPPGDKHFFTLFIVIIYYFFLVVFSSDVPVLSPDRNYYSFMLCKWIGFALD